MKKKFLRTLLCLVCAFCCTFSLTACGGDDDDATKKYHTAAQWSAAFSDAGTTDCYSLQELMQGADGVWSQRICGLNYDKNSEYYYYSYSYKIVNGDEVTIGSRSETAYKTGGYYYTQTQGTNDNIDTKIYEITSAQFAAKTDNSSMDFAEKLLDGCKDRYADFAAHGSTAWDDVNGRYYEANNVRLEIDETSSIVFEKVTVGVTDAGALYDIEATFDGEDITTKDPVLAKHKFIYRNENSDHYVNTPRPAPRRLGGNTLKLMAISVTHDQGAPSHEYDSWVETSLAANSNKTITAKADGTLEGDIEIEMDGGATLALNTMKYTEDFVNAATYGDVTVSNAHIPGLTEAQKVTLTGRIVDGTGYEGYPIALRVTMLRDGHFFEFNFGLQAAD